jgi:DNA repair protein RadC
MDRRELPVTEEGRAVWRVCDLPVTLRPREEMDRLGPGQTPEPTLVAVLLGGGTRGNNVTQLACSIMAAYPTVTALSAASVEELTRPGRFKGLGRVKARQLVAAMELARRLLHEQSKSPPARRVRQPSDVVSLLHGDVAALDREVFWVILLDARNNVKGKPVEVSRGLLNASLVHPREVFQEAIRIAASAVVLAHNHPTGDPAPSAEDVRVTRQVVEAGRVVDIPVLDHVVIGRPVGVAPPACVSLRESGLVTFEK